MCGTVSEIEPAFGGKVFILRIGKPPGSAIDHAIKLRARRRLGFDLPNLSEVYGVPLPIVVGVKK